MSQLYLHTFLTLSNQMLSYKSKCIRISNRCFNAICHHPTNTVNSEIFPKILFLVIALKHIFVTLKICDKAVIYLYYKRQSDFATFVRILLSLKIAYAKFCEHKILAKISEFTVLNSRSWLNGLFDLILYVLVNNFSVMSWQVFLGWISTMSSSRQGSYRLDITKFPDISLTFPWRQSKVPWHNCTRWRNLIVFKPLYIATVNSSVFNLKW